MPPDAMLLTHTYKLLDPALSGQTLRLTSLLATGAAVEPPLLQRIFGPGAHLALARHAGASGAGAVTTQDYLYTDVALNGQSLTARDLATAAHLRDAVRVARRDQILQTGLACLDARWEGGLWAMHKAARTTLVAEKLASWMEPLARLTPPHTRRTPLSTGGKSSRHAVNPLAHSRMHPRRRAPPAHPRVVPRAVLCHELQCVQYATAARLTLRP